MGFSLRECQMNLGQVVELMELLSLEEAEEVEAVLLLLLHQVVVAVEEAHQVVEVVVAFLLEVEEENLCAVTHTWRRPVQCWPL